MFEVRANYDFDFFPEMDEKIEGIVGRISDFSGSDFKNRELGFVFNNEIEANKVMKDLKNNGFLTKIREVNNDKN